MSNTLSYPATAEQLKNNLRGAKVPSDLRYVVMFSNNFGSNARIDHSLYFHTLESAKAYGYEQLAAVADAANGFPARDFRCDLIRFEYNERTGELEQQFIQQGAYFLPAQQKAGGDGDITVESLTGKNNPFHDRHWVRTSKWTPCERGVDCFAQRRDGMELNYIRDTGEVRTQVSFVPGAYTTNSELVVRIKAGLSKRDAFTFFNAIAADQS